MENKSIEVAQRKPKFKLSQYPKILTYHTLTGNSDILPVPSGAAGMP